LDIAFAAACDFRHLPILLVGNLGMKEDDGGDGEVKKWQEISQLSRVN
jgi:hypothetical protein